MYQPRVPELVEGDSRIASPMSVIVEHIEHGAGIVSPESDGSSRHAVEPEVTASQVDDNRHKEGSMRGKLVLLIRRIFCCV